MKKQTIQIYHNPHCSKSRATLKLIEQQVADSSSKERNLDIEIIRYLDTPPDKATVKQILSKLGCTVRDIIRSGDSVYQELGLNPQSSDQALLNSLNEYPSLLQRPIVVLGDKAVIGRPPENVLSIL